MWIGLVVLSSIVVGIVAATGFAASGGFSPLFGVAMTVSGLIEAFNNAASFAFSIAVFHLVAPDKHELASVAHARHVDDGEARGPAAHGRKRSEARRFARQCD